MQKLARIFTCFVFEKFRCFGPMGYYACLTWTFEIGHVVCECHYCCSISCVHRIANTIIAAQSSMRISHRQLQNRKLYGWMGIRRTNSWVCLWELASFHLGSRSAISRIPILAALFQYVTKKRSQAGNTFFFYVHGSS